MQTCQFTSATELDPVVYAPESVKWMDLEHERFIYGRKDIEFYRSLITDPGCRLLELGCGTGRVLTELLERCGYVLGIDLSEDHIRACQEKLAHQSIGADRAAAVVGDVCTFASGQQFDLIIAPGRVFNILETDAQVAALFDRIREHLAPGGRCVLNAWLPPFPADEVRARWTKRLEKPERVQWETPVGPGRLVYSVRLRGLDLDRMVAYITSIYSYYEGDTLIERATNSHPSRFYYAEEFASLIRAHGFTLRNQWGGYSGEAYGTGSELIVEFSS